MQRCERRLRRGFDALRHDLFRRKVAGAQQAEAIDQLDLLIGRAADQPAIVELGRSERPGKARLAARDTRDSALDQQSGGNDAAPCRHTIEPSGGLVGGRIDVAGAAREGVEQRRAITAVAARQNVRRIGRPEEDALTPQMRGPCRIDLRSVRQKPAPDHGLGKPRAFLARRGGGEIAQPGEALELLGERAGCADGSKIEVLQR